MSRLRIRVKGSFLCDATGPEDTEAFDAVLDGVSVDHRVHRAEVEALDVVDVEEVQEAEEALATVNVAELAEEVDSLPAFQEARKREDFETEHGLEVFDCSTWPDDLVQELGRFLDGWARGIREAADYELLTMARGLELIGHEDEEEDTDSPEILTDRGRLLMIGYRAGKPEPW